MSVRRLVALVALALLSVATPALAGDRSNPEIADPGDDVRVQGGFNCQAGMCLAGMDFFWHNADVELVWVNDTADAVVFTMELRASEGFGANTEFVNALGLADAFTYTYTYDFAVDGHAHQVVVSLDDALAVKVTGDAVASASIDGRDLIVAVAKSSLHNATAGATVSGVVLTMHGESGTLGVSLDDRAPDANVGPSYVLNATSAGPGGEPADLDDEKAMPGLPLVGLLAVLVALVVLRRRV